METLTTPKETQLDSKKLTYEELEKQLEKNEIKFEKERNYLLQ